MNVIVVDDLQDNLDVYKEMLEPHFEAVQLFKNAVEAIEYLKTGSPDIIVLDVHMPDINGFELYEKIKTEQPDTPIVFITGDSSIDTTIQGLNLGAADFIRKPVNEEEMVARIKNKVIAHRNTIEKEQQISIGPFKLDCEMQVAEIEGRKVTLTPIEYKLIKLFAKNPNKIFSRDYIINFIWPDVKVKNQNIDTHLSNLRKKLSPFSDNLKTIKSRGYLLRV